jgi:hypothetical protein
VHLAPYPEGTVTTCVILGERPGRHVLHRQAGLYWTWRERLRVHPKPYRLRPRGTLSRRVLLHAVELPGVLRVLSAL